MRLFFVDAATGTQLTCWQQANVQQLFSFEFLLKRPRKHKPLTDIRVSIRINPFEKSLCSIIRLEQKQLPNHIALWRKVLLPEIVLLFVAM